VNIWVIYDHPLDRPDAFVARRWFLEEPTDDVFVAETLEMLRAKLPPGLVCLARHPTDDPRIVETWL
jgi:hypothetical protein